MIIPNQSQGGKTVTVVTTEEYDAAGKLVKRTVTTTESYDRKDYSVTYNGPLPEGWYSDASVTKINQSRSTSS